MKTLRELESERNKLYIKAFKMFACSPMQMKVRAQIDILSEQIKLLKNATT